MDYVTVILIFIIVGAQASLSTWVGERRTINETPGTADQEVREAFLPFQVSGEPPPVFHFSLVFIDDVVWHLFCLSDRCKQHPRQYKIH